MCWCWRYACVWLASERHWHELEGGRDAVENDTAMLARNQQAVKSTLLVGLKLAPQTLVLPQPLVISVCVLREGNLVCIYLY